MKHFVVLMMICMCTFLLVGCEKTIDASSSKAFSESVDNITESLSPQEVIRFKNALASIIGNLTTIEDIEAADTVQATNKFDPTAIASQQAKIEAKLVEIIDGKTSEEVIAEATKLQEKFEKKMLEITNKKVSEY